MPRKRDQDSSNQEDTESMPSGSSGQTRGVSGDQSGQTENIPTSGECSSSCTRDASSVTQSEQEFQGKKYEECDISSLSLPGDSNKRTVTGSKFLSGGVSNPHKLCKICGLQVQSTVNEELIIREEDSPERSDLCPECRRCKDVSELSPRSEMETNFPGPCGYYGDSQTSSGYHPGTQSKQEFLEKECEESVRPSLTGDPNFYKPVYEESGIQSTSPSGPSLHGSSLPGPSFTGLSLPSPSFTGLSLSVLGLPGPCLPGPSLPSSSRGVSETSFISFETTKLGRVAKPYSSFKPNCLCKSCGEMLAVSGKDNRGRSDLCAECERRKRAIELSPYPEIYIPLSTVNVELKHFPARKSDVQKEFRKKVKQRVRNALEQERIQRRITREQDAMERAQVNIYDDIMPDTTGIVCVRIFFTQVCNLFISTALSFLITYLLFEYPNKKKKEE